MSKPDPEMEAVKSLLNTLGTTAYYIGVQDALSKAKAALQPAAPGLPQPTAEEALALLNELTPADFVPPANRPNPLTQPFK